MSRTDHRLRGATGPLDVWVTLDVPSLATQQAKLAESAGVERAKLFSSSASLAKHRGDVQAQQAKVGASLASVGAKELGRVSVAHNAIAVRVDASQLEQFRAIERSGFGPRRV